MVWSLWWRGYLIAPLLRQLRGGWVYSTKFCLVWQVSRCHDNREVPRIRCDKTTAPPPRGMHYSWKSETLTRSTNQGARVMAAWDANIIRLYRSLIYCREKAKKRNWPLHGKEISRNWLLYKRSCNWLLYKHDKSWKSRNWTLYKRRKSHNWTIHKRRKRHNWPIHKRRKSRNWPLHKNTKSCNWSLHKKAKKSNWTLHEKARSRNVYIIKAEIWLCGESPI